MQLPAVMAAAWGDILANPWTRTGIAIAIAIISAFVLTAIVTVVFRLIARRREWAEGFVARLRNPFRVLTFLLAVWIAIDVAVPDGNARRAITDQILLIATIAASAWLVSALMLFFMDLGLARYRVDVPDNRVARRIRTQVQVLRRLVVVVVVVIAAASILLTFPGAQAAGTSLLASAGVISVVAGIAAQSTLGNVIAGMQLAFNGAIRVDDVVIVEKEWGRIEEITLTYVVVHLWDDRRLVLPSTYFTTTPFQNWTRHGSELLGTVEFDLDWRVPPAEMREEMNRILEGTPLWDGRTAVLQVTDAIAGYVRVRMLVTAADAPTLFDLRCHLREGLVAWVHERSPESIPLQRVQLLERAGVPDPSATDRTPEQGQLGRASVADSDVPHRTRDVPAETDVGPEHPRNASSAVRPAPFTGAIKALDNPTGRDAARDSNPAGRDAARDSNPAGTEAASDGP